MRRLAILLLFLAAFDAYAADGCSVTGMNCNSRIAGTLGGADCRASDGTYYDLIAVNATVGDQIVATMRPTSSSLTRPLLVVARPGNVGNPLPVVYGGRGASVAAVVTATGEWRILVGTRDVGAAGGYELNVECSRDPVGQLHSNCITQELVCGNTSAWSLTNDSCRFDSGSSVYDEYQIYGVAGDVLTIEMVSNDFAPTFVVYDGAGAVVRNYREPSFGRATVTVPIPATGYYYIGATSWDEGRIGFYNLSVSCSTSGCLMPVITEQPADVTVPFGTRATLRVGVDARPAADVQWFDATGLPALVGSGSTFQTAPVTGPATYYARVVSPCGPEATSRMVTVRPVGGGKRRATGR